MTTNEQTSMTVVRHEADLEAARNALPATATYTREQQLIYTREQLELFKRTHAKGATDDEVALHVGTTKRLGLDLFARQTVFVKRWSKRENREVGQTLVTIDGFRAVAARTGELDGQDGPYWCGADGKWVDVWLDTEHPPAAAKVIVFRKGSSRGFTGIARYASYVQRGRDGKPNGQWPSMPDVMTAKCAEALALRKAFPAELSGAYTPDEMGQADNAPAEPTRRETRPAPRKEPESEEPEIEIAEDWAMAVLGDVDAAETIEDLKALAPKINKMPRGSVARRACRTAYDAKLAALSQPE